MRHLATSAQCLAMALVLTLQARTELQTLAHALAVQGLPLQIQMGVQAMNPMRRLLCEHPSWRQMEARPRGEVSNLALAMGCGCVRWGGSLVGLSAL